jgi:hypothetical protein
MDKNGFCKTFDDHLKRLRRVVGYKVTQNEYVEKVHELANLCAELSKFFEDDEEFGCTLHPPHISWFKKGQFDRNFGKGDKPKNLLWMTVVFMYYYIINNETELYTWLLEVKKTCEKAKITDDGIEWVMNYALLTLEVMCRPWPNPLNHIADVTTEKRMPSVPSTSKATNNKSSVSYNPSPNNNGREGNTDELYLQPLEDFRLRLAGRTEPLPQITQKRIITTVTEIISTVLKPE